MHTHSSSAGRLPPWLRVKIGKAHQGHSTRAVVAGCGLHTVCQEARCPNIGECYGHGTATFLILGRVCTRNCRFCAVEHGAPEPVDPTEPDRVAQAVEELGLRFVVVTSVTRDDLADGGAGQFAATIEAVRRRVPGALVEVLVPDFRGDAAALEKVVRARPAVLNHNIETVRRLQGAIRPQADYDRSIEVLRRAKEFAPDIPTKSGIIVGLGETDDEIRQAMEDLRNVGCDILTIGQYLRPSRRHAPVDRYVPPEQFEVYRRWGEELGFAFVASGPFVRSSYRAAEAYAAAVARGTAVDAGE